jgi:hypothetical protein
MLVNSLNFGFWILDVDGYFKQQTTNNKQQIKINKTYFCTYLFLRLRGCLKSDWL